MIRIIFDSNYDEYLGNNIKAVEMCKTGLTYKNGYNL